jgi:hypothetical protein
VLHTNVVNVDRDVTYVASVSYECCKRLFKIFHLFQTYVERVLIWMFYIFHTYAARECFQSIIYFLSYIATSVFMLQVTSVLSGRDICCGAYTRML